MVAIAPFRAVRYAPEVDLRAVTTPPHDCRPESGWDPFLAEAHSIAHVVLARREGGDPVEEAAQRLAAWQMVGVMVRDQSPGLYLYQVSWGPPTARLRMRGLLCRIALDPTYTEIRRHEATLPGKKQERYALRAAIGMDPEPIWLLYRDGRGWVDEVLWSNAHAQVAEVEDEEGNVHTMWRVDRPEAIEEVVAQFEDRTLVIADGHHRYQTALDHWKATGREEDGSILACLSRDTDPGIRLVATHRLLHLPDTDFPRAFARLGPIPATPLSDARVATCLRALGPDTVVLVGQGVDGLEAIAVRLPPPAGSHRSGLVVARVHEHLLPTWGVDKTSPGDEVSFTRSPGEAIEAVRQGSATIAVLLPPEQISSVLEVASDGEVMPQKSTYFIPKLRSGLVLSTLDEPRPRPWTDQAQDPGRADFRLPPT